MKISRKTLVILAAVVWYVGGIVLFRSGLELICQAMDLRPGESWYWFAVLVGIVLGIIQAVTIFSRSCRRNVRRIRSLPEPKIWQFYRPGFFLALTLMITLGVLLDHFSQGHYFFMLGVSALDFALTISLLGSSYIFWVETKLWKEFD
jgi:hypothetical protein